MLERFCCFLIKTQSEEKSNAFVAAGITPQKVFYFFPIDLLKKKEQRKSSVQYLRNLLDG